MQFDYFSNSKKNLVEKLLHIFYFLEFERSHPDMCFKPFPEIRLVWKIHFFRNFLDCEI